MILLQYSKCIVKSKMPTTENVERPMWSLGTTNERKTESAISSIRRVETYEQKTIKDRLKLKLLGITPKELISVRVAELRDLFFSRLTILMGMVRENARLRGTKLGLCSTFGSGQTDTTLDTKFFAIIAIRPNDNYRNVRIRFNSLLTPQI